MTKCRITVLKVTFQADIAKAYGQAWLGPCPMHLR